MGLICSARNRLFISFAEEKAGRFNRRGSMISGLSFF